MKSFLRCVTLFAVTLMFAGSVWAMGPGTLADHVSMAPNNEGDVLIFPWYAALSGGWQTKLTVINTDTTRCVVAKVVVRSEEYSQELIDFMLYLSPGDVWKGFLKYDSQKGVVAYSDDDSSPSSVAPVVWPTPATSTTPAANAINQSLQSPAIAGDTNGIGYVEVITAASSAATYSPGILKANIYNGYRTLVSSSDPTQLSNMPANDPTGQTPITMYLPTGLPSGTSRPNVLAGYMDFQNTTVNLSTSLRATALKDYVTSAILSTGKETRLGEQSSNAIGYVEAALSKQSVAMPYVTGNDVALHFFTFPTKLTTITAGVPGLPDGPYFDPLTAPYCVPYTSTAYDLMENSPLSGTPFSGGQSTNLSMCDEVNLLSSNGFSYAEGWVNYTFPNSVTDSLSGLTYGAPVIPTYLYLGTDGLSANNGAWADSLVMNGSTGLTGYHYTHAYLPN